MAKDKENKGGLVNLSKVTDENIAEQIKNANKYSEEIVKAATEKAEKDEKDRQIREFNEIKDKATYVNLKSVLRTRRDRAAERATSEMRKTTLDLLEQISNGKMTAKEYENALDEAIKTANEACKKANKEYDDLSTELRNKFPGSWRYDWDDPYRRVKTDARLFRCPWVGTWTHCL